QVFHLFRMYRFTPVPVRQQQGRYTGQSLVLTRTRTFVVDGARRCRNFEALFDFVVKSSQGSVCFADFSRNSQLTLDFALLLLTCLQLRGRNFFLTGCATQCVNANTDDIVSPTAETALLDLTVIEQNVSLTH